VKSTFFRSAALFREWLRAHHDTATELLVGFYKTDSGKPSITWPESVDEALCYGWIDGRRKRLDDVSYTIRFTPRKPGSTWSAVNTKRAQVLIEHGQMAPAGLKAFNARRTNERSAARIRHRERDDEDRAGCAYVLIVPLASARFFAHADEASSAA
jgi:uncharacterized protein YdeI (YjbR/CyaY-like superfamily)